VKLIRFGTPKIIKSHERAISGRPTSNETPTGTHSTATKIADVTNIALQLILAFNMARNVRKNTARLNVHDAVGKTKAGGNVFGACAWSLIARVKGGCFILCWFFRSH
jgi:hypothetical protein